jgi:hypothetical protein
MDTELAKLLSEYFILADGARIEHFQEKIFVYSDEILTLHIPRRALKHLVEQRKKDAYTLESLVQFFADIRAMCIAGSYSIKPKKTSNAYEYLLIETSPVKNVGVVLVLELVPVSTNSYLVKTGFYRSAVKLKKISSVVQK